MQRLSSWEFTWLKAYSIIEPFGAKRDNFHAAMLASLYTNAHKKQGSPPAKLSDFFYIDPETLRHKKQQEQQQSGQNFAAFLDQKVEKQNNGN
jgi:hypothetical protein